MEITRTTTTDPVFSPDTLRDEVFRSNYVSRDLSWIQFNYRVLDQTTPTTRSVFDRLRFLSITSSNLDEFCTIRLGSLYNYLDFNKERYDYSGLREQPFRQLLFAEVKKFVKDQHNVYLEKLKPLFAENGFEIRSYNSLSPELITLVNSYFVKTVYPMLTPMLFDNYHAFPILKNNRLLLGVVTKYTHDGVAQPKASFIQ